MARIIAELLLSAQLAFGAIAPFTIRGPGDHSKFRKSPFLFPPLVFGLLAVALPAYAQMDVGDFFIQKTITYDQSGPTTSAPDINLPYNFLSIAFTGELGTLLPTSSLTLPGGTILPFGAGISGLRLQQDFESQASMDAAFPTNGNYGFSIQTSTPNSYSTQLSFGSVPYPAIPQLVSATNATWVGGYLVVTDPTQPVNLTWNNPGAAIAGVEIIKGNSQILDTGGVGSVTTFALPANLFAINNSYYTGIIYFYPTNSGSNTNPLSSAAGFATFQTQVRFAIQVGTPTLPRPNNFTVEKSHVQVQTSNSAPADVTGDNDDFSAAPYALSIHSPTSGTGTVTGPGGASYALGYAANGGENESSDYEYSSGAVATLGGLTSTYRDGSYTLSNGDTVNLNGGLYPNSPQVTAVNGATPVWNAQGQLVLNPSITNIITFSAINLPATTFASAGHELVNLLGPEDVDFEAANGNDIIVQQRAGVSESSTTSFNTLTIPVGTMINGYSYTGQIEYLHATTVNNKGGGVYEVAGYQTQNFFTVAATTPVVQTYEAIKENVLVQTSAAAPVNATGYAVDPAPYNFYAKSPVAGSVNFGEYLLDLNSSDQNYEYRSSAEPDLTTFNAAYPDTDYDLPDGHAVVMSGDVYPNAPQVTLVNGSAPTWSAQGELELDPTIDNTITFNSFTTSNSTFSYASGGHESVNFQGNQDSVKLKQKAFGPTGDAAFNTFTIPADTMTPGNTYTTSIGYTLASGLSNPSPYVYDIAGYETEMYFTVAARSNGTTAQTITFPSVGAQQAEGTSVTLGATSDSGLPVSYVVVSGPASISGSQLNFNGTGAVTVDAVQAGNDEFQPAVPVAQSFTVSLFDNLGSDSIQKSISYDQSSANPPTLDPQDPYQFSSSIYPGQAGITILPSSTLVPPPGTTGLVTYQASDSGVYFQDNFPTQSALDAAFSNGIYHVNIELNSGAEVLDQIDLTGDNYPVVPQITNITNATWSNNRLLVTDPTQPVTFTWNDPNGAGGNLGIQPATGTVLATDVFGVQFLSGSEQTTYTLPGGSLANNTLYQGDLEFNNTTGNVGFQTQVKFLIQTGTPTPSTSTVNSIEKAHILVQSSNSAPVDGYGDLQSMDPAPYNLQVKCTQGGTVTGPSSLFLALGYHAGSSSSSGNYRYSSGPVTSQANLDSAYPDGAYTLPTGNGVSLTGDIYPNTPQVTLVNGATPTWNSQGQVQLDPAVTNTITFSAFNVLASTFAAVGHETVDFESLSDQDDVELESKAGLTETSSTPFTTLVIPANTMTSGDTYVGDIEYLLASSISTVSTGVYDAAGYATETYFTAIAVPHTGAAQTITFPAINPTQYIGSTLVLSATSSSGLPVSYSFSGAGVSLVGNVMTFTGEGVGTLTAMQAGNSTYGAAPPVSQNISIIESLDLSSYEIEKSVNYVQSGATNVVLQAEGPYQFSANVQGDSGPQLLSSSTVAPPTGSTGSIFFQADSVNGLNFDQDFITKSAMDSTFASGTAANPYAFTIQTSTPSTYIKLPTFLGPDGYPTVIPQLTTVTNATWTNGYLEIIDPTQPTTFNWNVFNSAFGNINFNINNLNVGQGFTANGTNTSFTVPANTFSSNTAYVGELDFSNSPTIPGAFPGIFGGADFANRVQFGIQVGTVPSGTSRYTVSKSHVLVQTANTAPVNSSGDRGGYDASPYEFHLDSPVAGTDTGPNSKTYPLVYNPYGGDNDTGNFEFSSGAVASQATLDSTYANGNYTMVNGTTVALTGSVYPNVPQVMSVNGGTPVWNALGQLVLDPTVANTITWTAFNEAASTFATNGHVDAQIESNNSNNLDIELQSGATETNLAPINSLTIPANAMTVNDTYVGRIQYFLASALTNPNTGVYDVAGYATTTNFTAVAQPSPIYRLSLTSSGEDFSSNSSFNVTGETLQLTLNFAPYPGEVLTILNNTGSGPIVGNFNNLPDGGTITLVYNGTPYIFTANYEGGDGNDLTLTYTPPISHSSLAVLHSFLDGSLAGDGSVPVASLVRGSDGNFYGTTQTGGSANYGTIFRVTTQGIVSILHSFGDGTVANDGNGPDAPLVQGTDGNFYGTTVEGGSAGLGTVFKITSGGGVTILHSFGDGSVANDGNNPECGLIQSSDGNFYGTAEQGGLDSFGVVFKITPAGVVSILHSFGTIANDGEYPEAAVVQASDGNYYGTTEAGGSAGFGAVFKLTSAGTVTIQHSFGDGTVTNDGKNPVAALIQSTDGNFYGTASDGGFQNNGTLFKITPQGAETILHVFGDGSVLNDGSDPEAALILGADGNYYGTTEQGGAVGSGSIFKMTPQGVMTILHSFGDGSVPSDGTYAIGGLIQDTTGIFYGTTSEGGGAGEGTIYKLAVAVPNVTSALTASGTVSLPFRYQTAATNTPTSYTAINLPAGLTINNVTGLITGTPVIAGTFNVTLTLTNASGSTTVTLTITIVPLPPPVVTSILYAYGSTTAAFNYQTTATNNPTSYSATGLPDGLEIDPSTGAITGTPTTVGTYPVSVSASNASGTGNSVNLSISIFGSPPTLIQEYDVLHNFGDGSAPNDAQQPSTLFQGFDGNFYGASTLGGAGGLGAIFETNVQGTTSVLNSATSGGQGQDVIQGSDGNFYGTNLSGGANLKGFIYQLTPQGALRVVHTFGDGSVPNDGANPNAGMIQGSDGNFYGTTSSGGSAGEGTVFQLTPQGVLTILHSFGDNSVAQDGLNPENGLIQATGVNSSIIFYGTTQNGGSAGTGTVYTITSQGVVTILHSFGSVTNDGLPGTSNGLPRLVQGTDGNFYGVTAAGGSAGLGCAYQITPAGRLTVLHSFGTMTPDGANPVASLIEGLDGNFYGTTQNGGSASDGTVFQLIVGGTASSPTGTVNLIHQFGTSAGDGTQPIGSLFQGGDGNFYGTTATGGSAGDGTVFVIVATQTPAPTLVPVFAGASSATSSLLTPFSFTPKASFGFTGTGAQGNIKKAISKFDAGTAATYWELSGTLPQLLTFNSATGTIIGTPIQAGIFTIYLTAVINNVSSSPQAVTLDFDEPPVLNCPTTASGTAGSTFTYQITAAAGNPSNFGMTGLPFPGWLSVDTTSGLISGTPPASGTFTFSPTASNNSGTSTQQVTLRVTAVPGAPTITSASAASGTAGTPFTYQITAQNSPTSFTALTLPPGLTFNSATGLISGTPTTFGTFSVPIGATNNVSSSAAILTITIAPLQTPVITGNLSVLTAPGSPFSYQVSATGVVSSYAASNLPSGLTINSLTGLISGTPTVSGTFDATIAAENLTGESLATLDLLVANTSATVSLGNLAATYNGSPISATATTSPPGLNVTFTYNSSATPPTAAGSYTVVATINDPFYQGTTTSTLVIAPAPITVALKGGTSTYGQNISSLVPGISVTGLVKNDVVSSLGYTSVITGTGAGITTTTDAGSYKLTIVGALTNSNYMLKTGSASPVGGSSSWTVTQATLTVNALSGTSVYGQMPTTPSQLYTLVSSDGVTNQSALLSLLSGAPATSSYTFNITNATAGGKYATDKITSATLATGLNPRDYKVALGAAGAWTVTQDIITITGLTTGSSTYGSAPVFNSSSYFTVTDTDNNPDAASLVTNVKATLTATATSNAGTYSVAVSGALNTTAGVSATDYKIVLVPGSWKVNPQPVAISIAGGTSVYGAAPAVPALTGTGTVNGRSTPLTSALLKGFSTNLLTVVGAKGNSGVGTYAFNLTGAPTGNYTYSGTETAVTASWKITPATISAITVNKSASAVYGSYLIDKALTVTGLVNGDLPHLLGYTLTGLASNLGVGTYTFGVGGSLTDSNYTLKAGVISPPVAATGSKVTITAAPLTFTLLNGSSTYGTTPTPAQFNYSVTGLVNGDTVESTDILLGFTETPPITATTARGTIALKPVAPKVLSDPNYTASKLVGGTWTVH